MNTMDVLAIVTPRYVLLDGKERVGPKLSASLGEPEYRAVYAFSDKQPYDAFCANSPRALTPYPLVKGYLRDQIAASGDTVHLVAIDAAGMDDAVLSAATMHSVLEALEKLESDVPISFRLILDPEAKTYRVEKASSGIGPTNPSEI